MLARISVLASVTLLLSACVVGQKIPLDTTPQVTGNVGTGILVSVLVEDRREAVLSGKQDPFRIGQYRAGLGVPWPVTTEGKIPLADQVQADLEEELAWQGFGLAPGGSQLEVLIKEWDFTGYQNGRFWYSLMINVTGPGADLRISKQLADEVEIKGTFMLGARGGFERDMPGIYSGIIASIASEDPEVLNALKQ
jgi:hypothetical protein